MNSQTLIEPPQLLLETYEPEIYRAEYIINSPTSILKNDFIKFVESYIINKYGVLKPYNINPYNKFIGMSEIDTWSAYFEVTIN